MIRGRKRKEATTRTLASKFHWDWLDQPHSGWFLVGLDRSNVLSWGEAPTVLVA